VTAQQSDSGGRSAVWRWVVIVIAVLAIVAMLGLLRGRPGVGGRAPHPGDLQRIVHVTSSFG
jgi:hypothetical protein